MPGFGSRHGPLTAAEADRPPRWSAGYTTIDWAARPPAAGPIPHALQLCIIFFSATVLYRVNIKLWGCQYVGNQIIKLFVPRRAPDEGAKATI